MKLRKTKNGRYHLLDTVRGLCIAGMVVYHALFDCVYVFGLFSVSEAAMQAVLVVRDIGCMLFVALAGICEHFGKKQTARSLLLLILGILLSVFSHLFMPQQPVVFGVLSFMGVAGLFAQLVKKLPIPKNPLPIAAILFICFLMTFQAAYGKVGIAPFTIGYFPQSLYANMLTGILGFPPADFVSSDYFPLIPWLFLYFAGYYLWTFLQKREKVRHLFALDCRPLSFIGRYSLWFYLAHQPILFGILYLISFLLRI